MRAAVYEAFGPPEVVTVREIPTPVPGAGEVLVQVEAATVTAADWRIRTRNVPRGFGLIVRLLFGFSRPRQPILGTDASGTVVAVGSGVKRFAVGDPVIVFAGARMGCHAEFVAVKEDAAIVRKPDGVSFEEAAALCFGGTTMRHFYREAKLAAGERVLVVGAAGAVGTAAVQLAKEAGAHVTGVCSGANVELVRSLGADDVVDYERTDVLSGETRFDVIVDAAGSAPYARCAHLLNPGGRLLGVVADLPAMLEAAWVGLTTDRRIVVGSAPERAEDLEALAVSVAAGTFRPVIGARFPLERIVEAHRLVETGHKRGNAVVFMRAGTDPR